MGSVPSCLGREKERLGGGKSWNEWEWEGAGGSGVPSLLRRMELGISTGARAVDLQC